jgi:two-component system chemotaxis sensor kinase CheA
MASDNTMEPMLDMYLFETVQQLEQLEKLVMSSEKTGEYTSAEINEIFRIMHTIKGSSAMMLFDNIATLAHSVEDVFFCLRQAIPSHFDCAALSDLILTGIDFMENELAKLKIGSKADGDASLLGTALKEYLADLKASNPVAKATEASEVLPKQQQYYISPEKAAISATKKYFRVTLFFQEGCEMENIRAYTVIHNLKDVADEITYMPENIIEDNDTADLICQDGFQVVFATDCSYEEMQTFFENTIFLKELELAEINSPHREKQVAPPKQILLEDLALKQSHPSDASPAGKEKETYNTGHQSMISVNVMKLDRLMDLVGELVIAEAMVTQNPDLRELVLDNFSKSARQLEKITGELQDTVMSIRMVPLATTFQKMNRVIRDMCKKLGKEAQLELVGEETEVDKNITEHISDPLMHLLRNSLDHGIEAGEERIAAGKSPIGKIKLEARNVGSDVVILIKDDGRGLNKQKILERARENGLIHKSENDLTDKEIYSFILAPGFSTKDKVTEFSGRGVGMDVVTQNINSIGGVVVIESLPGNGTTISLKIPLTLAIVDGMIIGVGDAKYTIPITAIRESFRPRKHDLVVDPDGNEMIMVRGQCHPILRIHRAFKVNSAITSLTDGIIVMVENENDSLCLFADILIGEQQVVVKALPPYIKSIRKVAGLAGCTLLGDGSISLILDIGGMMNLEYSSWTEGLG